MSTTLGPSARTLTREDLIRAGQAGRPWDFLPLAAQALEQLGDDQALRFLTAANLARLGLRTLAQEQLETLPAHPDVHALRVAVARLPDDRVTLGRTLNRAGAVRKSLAIGPTEPVSECFRTLDQNLVTRPLNSKSLRAARLVDEASFAKRLVGSVRQRSPAELGRIVLDGFSPHLFKQLYDATPTNNIGHSPRIIVVQRDPAELLEGLAATDLSKELADPRVELFVGEDASTRLSEMLRSRTPYALPTIVLSSPITRAHCTPSVGDVVSRALDRQRAEFEEIHPRVEARYAARDTAYWQSRFAAPGTRLRVLVPTTRYSTYVQHAAADLVSALQRAGHTAQTLIEPDSHTQLSANAYLRVIDELDPDLIVLINYPRATRGKSIPAGVPYITWIQDAMPHLFGSKLGRSHTNLDFIAGHTFADLFLKHEYPTERLLPISLVADPCKFHRGPVPPDLAARHACDIAFVSHHSETPQAMFERLRGDMRGNPAVQRAMDRLWPQIQQAAAEAATTCHHLRLRNAVATELRAALGHEPDADTHTKVYQHAAIALVDRLIRHETLEWAATIARQHRFRFHIYGKGWDKHPTLAEFAKGELPHNEELRASYRCAAVHLHLSGTALVHQRVMECYLAGGFCTARLFRDAHAGLRTAAELATLSRTPDHIDTSGDRVGYTIADHPEFMSLANHLARLGHPHDGPIMWFPNSRRANQARLRNAIAPDHDPAFLLRDLAETTFQTREQLEAMVLRALNEPQWRDRVCEMVSKIALEHLTTDALARRMIEMVRTSFEPVAEAHP